MRTCLAPLPPRPTISALPAGTVDTHCHVIGPARRFPFADGRSYTPPDAPVEALAKLRDTLGIARSVIVQPGPHGFDNRVTLDAIAQLDGNARGIAVVPVDTAIETLRDLDRGGIRGVRLSSLLRGDAGLAGLGQMARRIEPLGWHLLIHLKSSNELLDIADTVRNAPVPVIVDHMARTTAAEGIEAAPFRTLLDLLCNTDHVWTKVCSWYRISDRPDDFEDMRPIAEAVIAARPDRVLWGSNWPHPLLFEPPMPDDAMLADQFTRWAGANARRILVDNPLALYDFEAG